MNTKNNLGTENIYKLFAKFTIPAVIAMVISGSQSIIDGIFVGNYVGQNALASINVAIPFMQIIIGISMVLSVGALSIIGRSLGEGNKKRAQNTFKTALILTLGATIILAIVCLLFGKQIAMLLGASELLVGNVSTYITIMSVFSPVVASMFLFGFTDRIIGKPNLYLFGTILSVIVNVTLDYILIKHLKLGVMGAALASSLAYASAFLVVVIPMLKKKSTINIYSGKFDLKVIFPMVYNGSSEAVTSASAAITVFIFNNILMSIAGESGIAAYTAISYVTQFATLIMFGVSDGVGPLISYNFGHKRIDRVKTAMNTSVIVNIVVGVTLFMVMFFFGRQLTGMFLKDGGEVVNMATQGAKIYGFALLMSGFNILTSAYFTQVGFAKESIIIAISRGLVFVLLGVAVLPQIFGLPGIWLAVPFAEVVTMIIAFVLLRKHFKLSDEELGLTDKNNMKQEEQSLCS